MANNKQQQQLVNPSIFLLEKPQVCECDTGNWSFIIIKTIAGCSAYNRIKHYDAVKPSGSRKQKVMHFVRICVS